MVVVEAVTEGEADEVVVVVAEAEAEGSEQGLLYKLMMWNGWHGMG
jgi:hypothetical protein